MAIAVGDRVSIEQGGPVMTVTRILDNGDLECIRHIEQSGASGEVTQHAPESLHRIDSNGFSDGLADMRAETEPSAMTQLDGATALHPDWEAIRIRAYAIWEAAGRPDGQHEAHWLQAEQELGGWPQSTVEVGGFVSATGRMTPSEAYDEDPTAASRGRSALVDQEVQDEP